MAYPQLKHPGSAHPTSKEYNDLIRLSRGASRLTGGTGFDSYATQDGQTVGQQPTIDSVGAEWATVLNDDNGSPTPPLYGIGEIYDAAPGQPGLPPQLRVRRPTQPGFSSLCVFMPPDGAPPPGQIVQAQISGIAVVQYQDSAYPLQPRTRLGCTKDSWLAQVNPLGPFLVQQDFGMVGAGHYASVKITGERGDMKAVIGPDGTAYLARAIIVGDGMTLGSAGPCTPQVNLG